MQSTGVVLLDKLYTDNNIESPPQELYAGYVYCLGSDEANGVEIDLGWSGWSCMYISEGGCDGECAREVRIRSQ